MFDHARAADDRRDAEADVADPVGTVDPAGDRQDATAVERDRVDDLADGDPDGITGSTFAGDNFCAALLRALEDLRLERGRNSGELRERKSAHRGGRPDRQHGVAVLAEDDRAELCGREVERAGDERTEAGGIKDRAEPENLRSWQAGLLDRKLGKNIHGV